MAKDGKHRPILSGCLSHIGLAVVIGLVAVGVGLCTILFPPWVRVEGQRQRVLFWSRSVQVHDSSFAGFHFIGSRNWRGSISNEGARPPSGEVYDAVDYRIYWRLLLLEWVAIGVAGLVVFVYVSRRLEGTNAITKTP